MYINDDNATILENDKPVWEETGLKYNYDKENHREKVLDWNIDEVKDIFRAPLTQFLVVTK